MDFLFDKSMNLDGTPAEDTYQGLGEPEESFEWEAGFSGKDTGSSAGIENFQFQSDAASAPAPEPVKTTPLSEYRASAARGKEGRPGIALATLFILLFAAGAAAYSSLSGLSARAFNSEVRLEPGTLQWEGHLMEQAETSGPGGSLALPELLTGPLLPGGAVSDDLETRMQKIVDLMFKDTRAAYDEALAEIETALEKFPGNPVLNALRVEIVCFRESRDSKGRTRLKSEESQKALSRVSDELEDHPLMLRVKAHVLLNDKKTAASRALINRYLKQKPTDPVALYILGMTYRFQPKPDLEQAAYYLKQALKYQPDMVQAFWDLAEIYRKQARWEDALDMFNHVLTLSPDREGTTELMEETAKAQAMGKTSSETSEEPLLTISISEKQEKTGIEATGDAISDNILEAFYEAEPSMRKMKFAPAPAPVRQIKKQRPRPPEEAPE